MEQFFKFNALSHEDLSFIVSNYPKIGINSNNEKEENFENIEKDVIKKLIQILPIKYFIFDIQDGAIVKLSFYFKLAKICFLEYIFKKIYELFEQTKLQIPERTIGDLLEIIVIEYFKNNSNEKIDQVTKVDSIWNIGNIESIDIKKVNENNILIIQKNEKAKLVDFGFLLKGEILVLFQCKKALSSEPKDYVNLYKIFKHKNYFLESFEKHFGCSIKRIKLLYITGIYFTNRKENLYHSWSKKDQTFGALEKITKQDNIPLVFFDVQNKNLLIKNEQNKEQFDSCTVTDSNSLICDSDRYNDIKIVSENEELSTIFEDIIGQNEIKSIELFKELEFESKSENKTHEKIYEYYLKRKLEENKRINIKEPDAFFLNNKNENILTTFKLNSRPCFAYYDSENKKMKYLEIQNEKANNLELKDMKMYYLQKKRNRTKKK